MSLGCGCTKPKPVVICPKECDPDSLTPMGLYNGYEGEWKKGKVYSINQTVYHDKKFYVSLKNCNDAEPTGSTDDNWYLYSDDEVKALAAKDKEQDDRLDAIEDKNKEQDDRLDAGDDKDKEQDDRLDAGDDKDKEQDDRLDAIEDKNEDQDDAIGKSSSGKRTIEDGKVYMVLNNGDKVEQRDVLYRLDDSILI